MECPKCGAEVKGKICEYCGCEMPERQGKIPTTVNTDNSQVIINNYYQGNPSLAYRPSQTYINVTPTGNKKSKTVALILCIFIGYFGAHKFYEGKTGMGVLYIFTLGLFGIGWIVDIVLLAKKPDPYYV